MASFNGSMAPLITFVNGSIAPLIPFVNGSIAPLTRQGGQVIEARFARRAGFDCSISLEIQAGRYIFYYWYIRLLGFAATCFRFNRALLSLPCTALVMTTKIYPFLQVIPFLPPTKPRAAQIAVLELQQQFAAYTVTVRGSRSRPPAAPDISPPLEHLVGAGWEPKRDQVPV